LATRLALSAEHFGWTKLLQDLAFLAELGGNRLSPVRELLYGPAGFTMEDKKI
jgi:hypothetical protein